ncbi:hypothetical protein HPP92_002232 [Vanilla planifolia]|uniref:Dihydrolipoamide acetyltransferase component of pyruvate dehydrogenase complex n=1 Tax=Vanilla planifolia TaxID=51239 RepID=A0A835RSL5_VANPL|nr:hypothetical protein HPP92_002232 [Vanilla planifolia]
MPQQLSLQEVLQKKRVNGEVSAGTPYALPSLLFPRQMAKRATERAEHSFSFVSFDSPVCPLDGGNYKGLRLMRALSQSPVFSFERTSPAPSPSLAPSFEAATLLPFIGENIQHYPFLPKVRWRRQEKALRSVTPQMFVEEGDHVEEFQPICEVQSDKATMEITSKDGRVMKEDILRSTSKGICKELPSVLAVHAERSDHFKKENQNMLHLHWEKLRDKILPLSAPYGDQINFSKENTDQDVKHTFLPFLVKSLSIVLNKHPLMNSSFSEDSHAITLKGCHNIGVAMATPYGLVVPNIKNVQSKSMLRFLTTYG